MLIEMVSPRSTFIIFVHFAESKDGYEHSSIEGTPLGGVYMRKLAPARVSYPHDVLISYRIYMMTGLFHISLFEGTLHVDKMHV